MDNIWEKLDSFGLELVFSNKSRMGLEGIKTAIEDEHLNSWKPVTFEYLINEKGSLKIADFQKFHQAFQLPKKYKLLNDIFFENLTVEYENEIGNKDEKEMVLYFNRSFYLIERNLEHMARMKPKKLLLSNKKLALQYTFNQEQACKAFSYEQVDLAKELKEEPQIKKEMKIFRRHMERLTEELLQEIIEKSYQES